MTASDVKLLELQDFTPYPNALRWEIQARYYARKGPDAWLDKDVPDTVTCNSFAALNNATLVLEAVMQQEASGALAPDAPVVVLEYGAGLGVFAYNFMRRFEQVCRREGKDYAQRLVYIATDYVSEGVKALCKQPFLQNDLNSGKLRLAVADVTQAAPLTYYSNDSTGINESPGAQSCIKCETADIPSLSAVITNYLHCCLPVEFLKQEGEHWFTRSVKTRVALKPDENEDQIDVAALLQQDDILDRLIETERWDPIDLQDFCIDDNHHAALKKVVAGRGSSRLLNAVGSLKSLAAIWPLLRTGGIYVIHDKGIIDTKPYGYGAEAGSSTHGSSTAYMTNFPLLQAYAKAIGYQDYLTPSYQYLIQSLLLEKSDKPSHKKVFRYLYGDFNLNSDLVDLQNFGDALARAGETKKAAEAFQKCLRYRSLDADLYYRQGELYVELDIPQRALLCAQKGRPLDHFQQHNFAFIEGHAHFKLENYTLATKLLENALLKSKNASQSKKIERVLFKAHNALGRPAEDFTPEAYPALDVAWGNGV